MRGKTEGGERETRGGTSKAERRARVIDSFIDLVLEGNTPPTPEQVRERAGVSAATFYRYFKSLDDLREVAARRAVERFGDLYSVPEIGIGSRSDRIHRFVDNRVVFWEKVHYLDRLIRSRALRIPEAQEFVNAMRRVMTATVERHFEPELRRHSSTERANIATTISVLTSGDSWEQFREGHGFSPFATGRAWALAIDRVLDGD
jgi:AcrR family transcriptional regulator